MHSGSVVYKSVFYGVLSFNDGSIFKINPDGTGFTKLHDFNGLNGSSPYGDLIIYSNAFYGLTSIGGINSAGTIFSFKP